MCKKGWCVRFGSNSGCMAMRELSRTKESRGKTTILKERVNLGQGVGALKEGVETPLQIMVGAC